MKDNSIQKIIVPSKKCCGQIEEIILKRLTLKSDNKKTLIEFVDVAKQFCEDQIKKSKKSSNKTVKVFLWRKNIGIYYLKVQNDQLKHFT